MIVLASYLSIEEVEGEDQKFKIILEYTVVSCQPGVRETL